MKSLKYYILGLVASAGVLTSCDQDFVDINKNPDSVYEVDPVSFLYKIEDQMYTAGEAWSDAYACRLIWMQYCTNHWYRNTTFTDVAGFGNNLYRAYNEVGKYTRHIPYYIKSYLPDDMESYSDLIEVSKVLLITKGIQATDTYGSLVYTEGWGARGENTDMVEPKFETQEELFTLWNEELKNAAQKLSSSSNQKSIAAYDVAYKGDVSKWVKATNAVRLRLALRLWKRNPELAKSIAKEVLNSGQIFEGTADGLVFYFDNFWVTRGDWQSVKALDRASHAFMGYLKKYNDPRKRLYFYKNNLTPETIAEYNANPANKTRQIPTDLTEWEGATVNADEQNDDPRYIKRSMGSTDMQVANKLQVRMFKASENQGNGGGWIPILTYADFCFMAAEFTLEGVENTKSAQQWYEEGVKSSLKHWSAMGDYCKIFDYQAVTDAEIDAFMAQEGIAWADDVETQKQQIYCQTFVDDFKNTNECWAMYRRTNYPNTESKFITWEEVKVNGELQRVPRRNKFSAPAAGIPNYENEVKRFEEMSKDPDFGRLDDEYGRVWWDVKK